MGLIIPAVGPTLSRSPRISYILKGFAHCQVQTWHWLRVTPTGLLSVLGDQRSPISKAFVLFGFVFASKYGFFGMAPSPSRDPPPAGQKPRQPESRWQMAPASSARLTVWTPRPALASPLWERDERRGRAQRKRVQEPRSEKRRRRVRSGP